MKYLIEFKLFEKTSFNAINIPQKFIHYLHTNVPIKQEEFELKELDKTKYPNISKFNFHESDNYVFYTRALIIANPKMDMYAYVNVAPGSYYHAFIYEKGDIKKITAGSMTKALTGGDVNKYKRFVNSAKIYTISFDNGKPPQNTNIQDFLDVYGDFMVKVIKKTAKNIYDRTWNIIKDKTNFDVDNADDVKYYEDLYNSLKKLKEIYNEKDKSWVGATIRRWYGEIDNRVPNLLADKYETIFRILKDIFNFGLYSQLHYKRRILNNPEKYDDLKVMIKDPDIKKELDYLERSNKSALWGFQKENKHI